MTISSIAAAKRLCASSGWQITNNDLQRLLYLAQMLHLGRHGEPLLKGDFESTLYGPVEHRLYRRLMRYGSHPIRAYTFRTVADLPEGDEAQTIDEVLRLFWPAKLGVLVANAQYPDGAWARNYMAGCQIPGGKGPAGAIIPLDDIAQEYRRRTRRQPQAGGAHPAA